MALFAAVTGMPFTTAGSAAFAQEASMKPTPKQTYGALSTAEEIEDVKYRIEELQEELEGLEQQLAEEEEENDDWF
jgi:TolA-binding protein